jgi:hypothetical protein
LSTTTITVRRPVTFLLLLAATAVIILVTMQVGGKSYSKVDPIPFEDLRHLEHRLARRPISTQILSVILVPIIANIALFLPWAFFLFLLLYTVKRPTVQTYVLTLLLGFSFSCTIEAVQYFLPTRVADINDIIWNSVGTLFGAVLGHLRARVRFEFE